MHHLTRFGSIVLLSILLIGCIQVKSVNQPNTACGAFSVEVFTVTTSAAQFSPLFGVRLPEEWIITGCSYSGDFSGTCTSDPQIDIEFEKYFNDEREKPLPTLPGYIWRAFRGSPTYLEQSDKATVTFNITPTTGGKYSPDYASGAFTDYVLLIDEGDKGFNQQIETCQISPIPTLSHLALIILVLMLGTAGIWWRRWHGHVSPGMVRLFFLSLGLTMIISTSLIHPMARAEGESELPPLSRENVILLIEQLRASNDPIDLSDPKAFVREHFYLNFDDDSALEKLDSNSLQTAIQFLLDAEDLSQVTCTYIPESEFLCAE